MSFPFYIVGPTAVGKSEIAGEVALRCNGEVVSADAFQIYASLGLLTAKPDAELLRKVPHHLVGAVDLMTRMDAALFRRLALRAIRAIYAQGKPAFVVGGSGMYVKALTHGLSELPPGNTELRASLNDLSASELLRQLAEADPETAQTIDGNNKHRLVRALEVCLLSGRPISAQRQRAEPPVAAAGVFLFRERPELYARIDARVKWMFANDVVGEVRAAGRVGPTAAKTLGFQQIRDLIAGRISEPECIAAIQQATRRYAKRQLTWFRRQSNFEPLNLSLHDSSEAIEWIAQKARLSFAPIDD